MTFTSLYNTLRSVWVRTAVVVLAAFVLPSAAHAFDLSTYTEQSRLAKGRWVKIAVTNSGVHLITTAQLRQWGFNDPSKVRIYGYGGKRLSDVLSLQSYIDDLPPVCFELTPRGLVFYAEGVETWTYSTAYSRWQHTINPFSTVGYYFLTTTDDETSATDGSIATAGKGGATAPATTFTSYLYHEKDQYKLGETGHLLLGEDFRWNQSQTFNFNLVDIEPATQVTMRCQMVARTLSANSMVRFSVNGSSLPKLESDYIRATGNTGHSHGEMGTFVKTFTHSDSKLTLGISLSTQAVVNAAHLDFLEFNYTRKLRLPSREPLTFDLNVTGAMLADAPATTRVWDVTNPRKVYSMVIESSATGISWTNDYTGMRRYVAWNDESALPSPEYVGTVANQNLHNPGTYPDMVIFTPDAFRAEAQRIAALHEGYPDSMTVLIVRPEDVYNEFGSGSPDVNTFRRYLKMLYDRGNEAGRPLRYALFIGKPTFDNRRLSSSMASANYPTLPTWQSESSLDDNVSFTTDDIFSFLEDESGSVMGRDKLCIAVGRIPARTAADAKTAVDKLYEYVNTSRRSGWTNQLIFLADDENDGIHMAQSEDFINGMLGTPQGRDMMYTKVYIDAFTKRDGGYPEARDRMFDRLQQGAIWWHFIGHANPTSWTGEKMLTYYDINNLYLNSYPILYAATCEFLNWDSSAMSGAEIMYFTRQGGVICAVTAVRPVYISENGTLGRAMAPHIFSRDEQGRFLSVGEMYRRGKNNITDSKGNIQTNSNKLRYVFMGDPAMRPATPYNCARLLKINGRPVDPEAQITIKAREIVTLEGEITDWQGNLLSDFDGYICADLFDAEHSTTSNGYGNDGRRYTFEEQGSKLFSGRDSVSGGRFKLTVAMPEVVADNFRPAALSMYAHADNHEAAYDAVGVCRDFYVYGFDHKADPDTVPPTIEQIYLNHPSFRSRDRVNTSPMLIADLSENLGFNLSTTGIGHNMSVQIDGNETLTNAAQYFTPSMGSLSGTIHYPLPTLTEGEHTVRLRVWDTHGNMAEETLSCIVARDVDPVIYAVYSDTNPASTEARFFLSHDRPDGMMTVTIEVFDLLGHNLWSDTATGRSDMFTSTPVVWNLTDRAGHRVNRGIYVYRATITESDGTRHVTASSKIAVTAY